MVEAVSEGAEVVAALSAEKRISNLISIRLRRAKVNT